MMNNAIYGSISEGNKILYSKYIRKFMEHSIFNHLCRMWCSIIIPIKLIFRIGRFESIKTHIIYRFISCFSSGQGFKIKSTFKPADGVGFCEILKNDRWKMISMWYDETGTQYPEETWEQICKQFPSSDWKSIRMVTIRDNRKIVVKIEVRK